MDGYGMATVRKHRGTVRLGEQRMEFRILGPLDVREDGAPVAFGGTKQRALLAILLLHTNEVVSTEGLIDALWDEPPAKAAKAVQVYASRLRKALGGGMPTSRPPGYLLEVEPERLDLARFRRLLDEARRDPARAADKLRDALDLWRGPALAEFTSEPFARIERLRLEELRLEALEERIEADLALGRHTALAGELEALVAAHPLRERLRGQLILGLYRCGRQAEALATYREARRMLVEELGIEPGRQLQELEQSILRQDPALDLLPSRALEPRLEPTRIPAGGNPPPAPPAVREERKVVSVLVADLVGTESEQADPEDVRARLRPYHAAAKHEIERFGGSLEKFVGDAVMGIFGAPVAHEDDAERAVRAALGILDAVEELNEAQPGLDLVIRSAVHTGEALVDLTARAEVGESVIAGDVVNTASRLQQMAAPGTAVVSERTCEATRTAIEYDELEQVTVKGKAAPLRIWRALGARGFGEEVEPARMPFVGREAELTLLRQALGRAVREASVQLATVTGEPGIGKTRLLAELRALVEAEPEPVAWRQGRCLPYGEGITFWALGEILKAQTGILESDSPREATGKLSATVEAVVAEASEREWFTARLAPLVGARAPGEAGTAERDESFTAWRRFFEALAAQCPLVLVFEDLHWADAALVEFLEHLVDFSTRVPLFTVCSARPELYERHAGWGGGKRNSTTVSLAPLTSDETARLLSALLSEAVLPAETQAVLLERSGGNPLYTEEFVRMLTDRGIFVRRDSAIEIAADAEIPVPETVQALVAARLDTLPTDRKSLLHAAAVVGRVFWAGAVSSIGGIEESAVRGGLRELVRKELVRPMRTSSIEDQEEFSFWHALVRDVAYKQMPRVERARKHQATAEWIERIAGGRVSDHAEILAYHYGQALELFRAVGDSDEADALEALFCRTLTMAGDRVFQLDVAKAESYYGRSLELLPSSHPERAAVLRKAAEAAWLAGRFSEAEARHEEAIGELRAQGNTLGLGGAILSLSLVYGYRGETRRARKLLGEAVELLERERRGPELARAYAQTAREHMLAEKWAECLDWSERALSLAEELGMKDVEVMALQFRGVARSGLGDLGGLHDLREALRTSMGLGLGPETVRAHVNLASVIWLAKGPRQALEIQRAGADFGERRGITGFVLWVHALSLWTLFDLGAWDELLEVSDELISWDDLRGRSYFGVCALCYKAQVLLRRGKLEEAASLSEEFLPRAREVEDPQVLTPALAVAALIEQARGNGEAAVTLIKEQLGVTPSATLEGGNFVHEAVRVCAAAGALRVAERLIEGRQSALDRHRHGLLTARATLAEAQGRLEEAARLYADAAQRWAEYGFVLERGQALLGEGRCTLALEKPERAEESLRKAQEIFERLDARPLAAEASAGLERAASLRP
jgi:DNA-binding SARP family transcriptional activator/class 3 adenylate cyclase